MSILTPTGVFYFLGYTNLVSSVHEIFKVLDKSFCFMPNSIMEDKNYV
jgi:hypothetical protein